MGTEFEREVAAIFDKRDFMREQKAISDAQIALECKKQQRKQRDRQEYLAFRWADRASAAIAGFFAGTAIFQLFFDNPVATVLCGFAALGFIFMSCAFCELADRKNKGK